MQVSANLKHAELQVMSNIECYNSLKQRMTEAQVCAGNNHGGTTVCNGKTDNSRKCNYILCTEVEVWCVLPKTG